MYFANKLNQNQINSIIFHIYLDNSEYTIFEAFQIN